MFKRKRKLYKIKYEWIGVDTIFIEATNQYKALKKFKKEMKRILNDIQTGVFAKNWILENQAGRPSFNRMRAMVADHQIEQVGKELRDKMPWLQK